MHYFNNLGELFMQAWRDGACVEGLDFLADCGNLDEALDTMDGEQVAFCARRGYGQVFTDDCLARMDCADWDDVLASPCAADAAALAGGPVDACGNIVYLVRGILQNTVLDGMALPDWDRLTEGQLLECALELPENCVPAVPPFAVVRAALDLDARGDADVDWGALAESLESIDSRWRESLDPETRRRLSDGGRLPDASPEAAGGAEGLVFTDLAALRRQAVRDGACYSGVEWLDGVPSLEEAFSGASLEDRLFAMSNNYVQFDRHCPWGEIDGWQWAWLLADRPDLLDRARACGGVGRMNYVDAMVLRMHAPDVYEKVHGDLDGLKLPWEGPEDRAAATQVRDMISCLRTVRHDREALELMRAAEAWLDRSREGAA